MLTSELVERVAEVIYAVVPVGGIPWESLMEAYQAPYREQARAAIKAVEEAYGITSNSTMAT